MTEPGTLYIVGTPIGNLEDITLRALRILKEVDLIAAEDTRHTLALLNHFEIPPKLVSYHEHNIRESGERLLADLLEGKQVALVTDAGMPCVSDPGWELVNAAHQAGVPVLVIPGPTAMASGIAWSGMDAGRFVFEGFLPRDGKPRRDRLCALKTEPRTMVFYEAPHRLEKTLKDILGELGDRQTALCKDITKFFERVTRGLLSELLSSWPEDRVRGEYVIVVEGYTGEPIAEQGSECIKNMTIQDHLRMVMSMGIARNDAIKRVATERGLSRRDVYQVSIGME